MKARIRDFLYRQPVRVITLANSSENELVVASRLPEDYIFEDGKFYFPAGFWEGYIVNGKDYNVDGNRSLEEQRVLIIQDLAEEGFNSEEANEFIGALETQEWRKMLLSFDESYKWLKVHPEFKNTAMQKLHEAEAWVKKERESESGRRGKRK